ncbi:hypothetical protein [Streptomyces sp. SID13031]|uniref:hypothetical protein n=1 Tax=Streptomyces sp. SID13031 TaxID=2706046 RepID=UPI001944B1A1|nr:hypothetical protein [Streptomyces sp. SID13031]
MVPASRPSAQRAINLSAELSIPLVILCSRQAKAESIAERVEKTFGARALVIHVPDSYALLPTPLLTSNPYFAKLSAGRSSDLSVKRNLGLRLARLRGWRKILFLDDDISSVRPQDIARLSGYLDNHSVAAMASRTFPDNSVVFHARRQARFRQDVFVGGAVLGVNIQNPATSFFPDVYNEDWFFFARFAAQRSLVKVGEVRQDEYKPFDDPRRAAREEFGDFLAEGLYALFESTSDLNFNDQLTAAGDNHWRWFKEIRLEMIAATSAELQRQLTDADPVEYRTGLQALESLRFAGEHLQAISSADCVEFIRRWRWDERTWRLTMARSDFGLSERDALDELGLTTWFSCGYGRSSRNGSVDCA